MSWILKRKRMMCFVLVGLILDIVLLVAFIRFFWLIVAINMVVVGSFIANRKVIKLLGSQKEPFGYKSKIRNVDCLIIGDMCKPHEVLPTDCETFVQIKAPHRSLNASFEVLKHTSSIVKEYGGTIVLVTKKKYIYDVGFSVFDIPFLADITIRKYNIQRLKKLGSIPLFIKPIQSIKLLSNIIEHDFYRHDCPYEEIIDFCEERGYRLYYFEK